MHTMQFGTRPDGLARKLKTMITIVHSENQCSPSLVMRGSTQVGVAVYRLGTWMFYRFESEHSTTTMSVPTCTASELGQLKKKIEQFYAGNTQ